MYIAEQYLEVRRTKDDKWNVELVVEPMNENTDIKASSEVLGTFNDENMADNFAEMLRPTLDKPIKTIENVN